VAFEFETLLRRRAERLAKKVPSAKPAAPVAFLVDGVFRQIQAWIAARLARARIVTRTIAEASHLDFVTSARPPEADEPVPVPARPKPPPAAPVNPFTSLTIEELLARSRRPMPVEQRLALEKVLNEKVAALRNPPTPSPEEHERAWREFHPPKDPLW
jgi:hypothetical protein